MSRLSERDRKVEQLRREHQKLEGQLKTLEAQKWLSPTDEAEVRRLKREKLARKDAIEQLTVVAAPA